MSPERERRIGARKRREVHVAFLRGEAAVGIDRDELRAAAFRLLHARPQMEIRDDRVGTPYEDKLASSNLSGSMPKDPPRVISRPLPAEEQIGRSRRRRAQPVEEAPAHRSALHVAHGAA